MRGFWIAMTLVALLPVPAMAQEDLGNSEIIVSGMRRDADGYVASMPAVTLKRKADFAVQQVMITGDTRDPDKRHEEMYATIKAAIALADKQGVQLAIGDTVIEPLTLGNYQSLVLKRDNRPDTDKTSFLVKTPLGDGVDAKAALARIDRFIKAVQPVGRALLERSDDLTLSVVKPDQYREAIIALVAEDARKLAARFGPDYAVEAKGLEGLVEWDRAGLTDVQLYIPYQLTIVPRR